MTFSVIEISTTFLFRHIRPTQASLGLSEGAVTPGGQAANTKATLLAFVSEKNLPISDVPDFIKLCKKIAENEASLKKLSMSLTGGTYNMTHGLAKGLKEELAQKLQKTFFFSFNVDEAANNTIDKIVKVMVQFYDEEQEMVTV